MSFPGRHTRMGLPFPPPGIFLAETEPASLEFPALAGGFFTLACGKPRYSLSISALVGQEKYSPADQDLPPVTDHSTALTGIPRAHNDRNDDLWRPATQSLWLSHSRLRQWCPVTDHHPLLE